jgi:hypothetical protein
MILDGNLRCLRFRYLFIAVGRTKTVRIDWLECDWGEIGNDQQITRLSTNY